MSSQMTRKPMMHSKVISKSKKKKNMKKANEPIKLDLSMCRTCNADQGNIPIFSENGPVDIPEEIRNFTGVAITETDQLPQSICQKCLELLNVCIMFRDLCQRTNKEFIEITIKKELNKFEVEDDIDIHDNDNIDYSAPSPNSDNTELECSTCLSKFFDFKDYNKHLKDCTKPLEHIKRSKDKKSFLCDTCGKVAKSKASLLVHMGTHENIFPYKCDECPYRGRTLDLLKVHKRSHLADKPFKCTQCTKACTTSSNLAKHMRHVHSTVRPHKCTYCDKAFSYQHDMKRHVRDIHLRTSTADCDVCHKKFNTKKILQGHRWKIHKIKGERLGRLPSYLQCQSAAWPKNSKRENNAHYTENENNVDNSAESENKMDYCAENENKIDHCADSQAHNLEIRIQY